MEASSWRLKNEEVEEIAMCLRHRYEYLVEDGASELEIGKLRALTERFETAVKNPKK